MTKISKWNNILDEEGGINISQTEPHSPFQNNSKQEIQQLQRLLSRQMKLYDAHL